VSTGRFPRSHVILVATLSVALCSFVVAKFRDNPETERFTTEAVLLDLEPPEQAAEVAATPVEAAIAEAKANYTTKVATVRPGDNLAGIFKRHGINYSQLQKVLESGALSKRLTRIYPGHELLFEIDNDSSLVSLTYSPGPLESLRFDRRGDVFVGTEIINTPDRVASFKHGAIDHSLFIASQRAGLDDEVTMRLAQIFQWDVDFVLDIRKGDEFHVLFEELYLEDEFLGYGKILAAEFVNQGKSYQAILYSSENGDSDYYDPKGDSMRKAFLRAPVSFSRISSNFNLRRVHPLFKRKMPHRGIDYAAPRGTPILAAGDGRVSKASKTTPNGNYVVLNHGEQFVTKYLHLSKFGRGVKTGKKVKQGQVIGYVGATGWATAPHLHYEFLVNGVHRNPRTVSLPDAEPINENERDRFKNQTTPLLSLLENYKQQVQLASAQ
jgi:murein DD-endopeptidase MepM/ murein hydrolase activator NlpD